MFLAGKSFFLSFTVEVSVAILCSTYTSAECFQGPKDYCYEKKSIFIILSNVICFFLSEQLDKVLYLNGVNSFLNTANEGKHSDSSVMGHGIPELI